MSPAGLGHGRQARRGEPAGRRRHLPTGDPGAAGPHAVQRPDPDSLPASSPSQAAEPPPARELEILQADDDPVNRLVLAAMRHCALEAEDGLAAIELCQTRRVDLMILDMHMPALDGPACARAMRALPGRPALLPILGLTADAIVQHQERYLADGLDAIYSKPIHLEVLEAAIANLFRKLEPERRLALAR